MGCRFDPRASCCCRSVDDARRRPCIRSRGRRVACLEWQQAAADALEKDLVAAWKSTAERIMNRIAGGQIKAHGRDCGGAVHVLEARWFRGTYVFFEADGTALPWSHASGEKGAWFDLQDSTLKLGRSEPAPWREAEFGEVTLDIEDVLELKSAPFVASVSDRREAASVAAVRRAITNRFSGQLPDYLSNADRDAALNEWLRSNGQRRNLSASTIDRALTAIFGPTAKRQRRKPSSSTK